MKQKLRFFSVCSLIFFTQLTLAQTRMQVLTIAKGQSFDMPEDTLYLDELIMEDSSRLVLNKQSKSSFIKAKKLSIASSCTVIGTGTAGVTGKNGKEGAAAQGACKNGSIGEGGAQGADGEAGKNFLIETDYFTIASPWLVKLNGGNGGDGGKGGAGSRGSRSTAHCKSDGGDGGNGGVGGNGGNGGSLTLRCHKCEGAVELTGKITLTNRGGYQGYGGEGGKGGQPGEGASEQNSKRGLTGKNGVSGKKGQEGTPLFYSMVSN